MQKEILIQVTKEETKVAVLEKKRLAEVYLERSFQLRLAGNIYKGRIENVLPGMQAAFVNIGLERNAFLYVEDVHTVPGKHENIPIQNLLREGEEILVQVVKEPFGTKGARVTTQLTLPGRYVVLLPDLACIGVSRRITLERKRERLKNLAEEVRIPGSGLIVRTVAEGVSREELAEDVAALSELWKRIKEKSSRSSAPALLYQDLELVSWVLRDLVGEELDRLVVNDPETYEKILELLGSDAHSFGRKVQLVESDLWGDYGIDQEVTRALKAQGLAAQRGLPGDRRDRGPDGDRRQHREIYRQQELCRYGFSHQYGGNPGDCPPGAAAEPGRDHYCRFHRHGGPGTPGRGPQAPG